MENRVIPPTIWHGSRFALVHSGTACAMLVLDRTSAGVLPNRETIHLSLAAVILGRF
ncbi:hypothetical protein FRUB_06960 [Fimbriiglobus ruber]|uniref:Uncharacterized protein n=1 Tax=Fimbriiglobus ruber TaxID=1908690 RepID=A0A225D8C5_9BACT|nr:hypothetical protein FRUB_06960 [Fimbriiglobus ruber]